MIGEWISRARYFFQGRSADLQDELRAHLEHAVASKVASGMTEAEAKRQAAIEFGSMEAAQEQTHGQHPRAWLEVLWQDTRLAVRSLRRDRGFAITALLILALGIGANIAVFSLVNTILLRPLPFHAPGQLVWLQPAKTEGGLSGATYSSDAYDDLRDLSRSFDGLTGYFAFSAPNNARLTGAGVPQPATSIAVIPNFLEVLGTGLELGRNFRPEDGLPKAAPVVILSYSFWKTHFHGDRGVVGSVLSINDKPVTIVGVLPKSFDFGAVFSPGTQVEMLYPFSLEEGRHWGNIVTLIGRLKPGLRPQDATREMATVFPQLYWSKSEPASKGSYGAGVAVSLKEHVAGQLRRSLYVLWAAVGMILLIVCVNLSNLLLGRAATRNKEVALRFALGASRGRLIRQMFTESCVLCLGGAALGTALAFAVTTWLAHQGSVALPLLSELRMDWSTLGWTVLLVVATTVCFGTVPSLRATASADLQSTLKDTGPGTSEGRRQERLRNVLIVSEVALACVLVVGAGLLLRSFLHVLDIDLGFKPMHAAAVSVQQIDMPEAQLPGYFQNLQQQVAAIPGVQSVGITDNLPLGRNRAWGAPGIKGVHYGKNDRLPTFVYMITPGYLATMGMAVHGRDFSWQDTTKSEPVIILNEKAARYLFPNGDAVDHMVEMVGAERRVIGVVGDIHETDVEASSAWQAYFPATQIQDMSGVELVLRSTLDSKTLEPTVLEVLRRINPGQPAMPLRPLQSFVDHSTSPRRFFAVLVGCFAGTGLLLACLGLYGVISYSVTRQTQEIGIRMALGASRASVLRDVIGRTLRLALAGIALGAIASVSMAHAIGALLYGTEPTDPATLAATMALLVAVSLVAGYLPARRAAGISPMLALRTQ